MPRTSVSVNPAPSPTPGGKRLPSKLGSRLPDFVLEEPRQDRAPAVLHAAKGSQADSGWRRPGFSQGLKGDDVCASKHVKLGCGSKGQPL